MGRIRVLEDQLINRIAAGEVVDRPASVVKELVENAIDAGARSIEVHLEGGGRSVIRVVDDGDGMDRDDCLLALERHATSKIGRGDALDAIDTLGFRGEALPSIASVSRLVVHSALRHGEGTEVRVQGGRIVGVSGASRPRGTTVEVANLFFNMPARRRFLRSETTELARIARVVTQYALAYPALGFALRHAGRTHVDVAPARDRGERVPAILGAEDARRLVPFDRVRGDLRVEGFAGRPVDARASRDRQHLFVNARPVQDRLLLHAVAEAYGNTVPKGRHPALLLFLEIPTSRVDVNVHPQKSEVRFASPSEVHALVRDAIASALPAAGAVPTLADLLPSRDEREEEATESLPAMPIEVLETRETPAVPASWPAPPPRATPRQEPAILDADRVVAVAQYLASYILAEDRDGLVIIDQHVAHERVLFERYLAQAEADRVAIQKLLFPEVVELAPEPMALFEEEREELRRIGFRVEAFGPDAVRIDAVPAVAGETDPRGLFLDLLGEAGRARSASTAHEDLRRRLITTAACKAAIKINHPLTLDGMQRLLDDLFRTANPTTCPHGRPVVFRVTREEIERAFRRR